MFGPVTVATVGSGGAGSTSDPTVTDDSASPEPMAIINPAVAVMLRASVTVRERAAGCDRRDGVVLLLAAISGSATASVVIVVVVIVVVVVVAVVVVVVVVVVVPARSRGEVLDECLDRSCFVQLGHEP